MKLKEKVYKPIFFLIIAVFVIMNFSITIFANDDYYISIILLTIKAEDNIIEQDDFFKIIDHDQYILIPLSALSSYLEIKIDYKRENEELLVYNPQKDEIVVVDFKENKYPDFPEWNDEPPLMLEGDFFVSIKLIEYLIDADLEWSSLKQELILDFADYIDKAEQDQETKIKNRPKKKIIKPEITGPNFSLGSLHYNTELNYSIEDLKKIETGDLKSNNNFYLHGRAGDWALSSGINLIYNFQEENYRLNYPLIRAINKENNRFIILGDSSIDFENTVDNLNTRGIYFQYPQIKLNKNKSYISFIGKAEEGSTVKLYLNQKLILEEYIYKGENTYSFTSVPLDNNRTNEVKIIIDNKGEKREIVKKIPGSNYIFEDKKRQTIFVVGKSKEEEEGNWENDIIAFQQDYGLSTNNSLSWELAAQRELIENKEIMNLGSLFRFAHRTKSIPTVTNLEWLVGGEKDDLENGISSKFMYTLNNGYLATRADYIPPEISDYVDAPKGGRVSFNLQHEIGQSWLFDFNASSTKSIKDMENLKLYQGSLSFNYLDQMNNSYFLGVDYGKQKHRLIWEQINNVETKRDWTSLNLKGRKNIKDINLKANTFYENNRITFEETSNFVNFEKGEINLDLSSRLSKNIITGISLDSKANWFEKELQEQNIFIDGKARYNSGNNFLTLGGISERTKNNSGDDEFQEDRREIYFNVRYFNYPNLSLFGEIKNTYLFLIDEDYYSLNAGVNYNNSDNKWGIDLELDYITPISLRDTAQEKIIFKLTKEFDSGLETFISASRDYLSFYQKEPSYLISVGVNQSLNFTKSNISGEKYADGRHRSYIGGIVYLDQEGTGFRNQDDPLLSDISVFREGTKVVTDENGKFKFQNVRSGLYEIGIDLNELDAKYNVLTENKIVQIRDNENIFLEFGLTMYGSISGKVYLDRKMTGMINSEDEFISMVGLEILELNKTLYSNKEGLFDFSEIPLGKYSIKVLTDTIPPGMKLAENNIFEVNITKNSLDIKNLDIRLIYEVE